MKAPHPRSTLLALLLPGAIAAGCTDAVAKPRPASEAAAEAAATPQIVRGANGSSTAAPLAQVVTPQAIVRPPGIGALENPGALRRFYEALARLEDGKTTGDVRVLQFGDSHTAADYETGAVRRAHSLAHLNHQVDRLLGGERGLGGDPGLEIVAVHVLHRDVRDAVHLARVVDGGQIRV